MTIHPSGAMALFVLRLAGLLSLEKSLGENSTDAVSNWSDVISGLNGSLQFYNLTNGTDGFFLPNFNLSEIGITPTTGSVKENLHTLENVSDDDYAQRGQTLGYFETMDNFTEENNKTRNGSLEIIDDIDKQQGSLAQPFASVENREDKKNYSFGVTKEQVDTVSHINLIKVDSEELEESSQSSSPTLAPRNSDTGFSPVFTKPLNVTPMLFLTHSIAQKSALSPPKQVSFKSVRKFNRSKLQGFQVEGDDNQDNFGEMQGVRTDYVTSDFQYFDYGDSDPELNSMSLISPIPKPRREKSFMEYLRSELEKTNGNMTDRQILVVPNAVVEDNSTETNFDLTLNQTLDTPNEKTSFELEGGNKTMKEMGPYFSSSVPITGADRNNPYPYGPKILSEHVLKYDPNLKPKGDSKIPRNLFPEQNFLFDYDDNVRNNTSYGKVTGEEDQEKKHEERGNKYFVKTERPTVLFRFDKPGYSPKLPDSSLPPT